MTESRWRYGSSWERYPIRPGEVWRHADSGSAVSVHDIRDPTPAHLRGVDLLYSDPPWNQGNVNSFVTKAGLDRRVASFGEFLAALAATVDAIGPRVCYLEAGSQHVDDVAALLAARWPVVERWPITYYRRHRCWLLRGGHAPAPADYAGLDDDDTPAAAIQAEAPASVADCCTGLGLTMLAAHAAGLPFRGTELNPRRLAVALERAAVVGWPYLCEAPPVNDDYRPPTPAEVRALLAALALSGGDAARLMGLSDARQVRKYTGGQAPRAMSYGALYALLHRARGLAVSPGDWRAEAANLLTAVQSGAADE